VFLSKDVYENHPAVFFDSPGKFKWHLCLKPLDVTFKTHLKMNLKEISGLHGKLNGRN
jgi:hypothetical protein